MPKILTVDYTAFAGLFFPLFLWAILLFLYIIGKVDAADLTLAPLYAALTAVSLLVAAWRAVFIRRLFKSGMEAPGKIASISFNADRGRVEYSYFWQGKNFRSSNAIRNLKATRQYEPGMPVRILLDGRNPQRAVIRDLYSAGS